MAVRLQALMFACSMVAACDGAENGDADTGAESSTGGTGAQTETSEAGPTETSGSQGSGPDTGDASTSGAGSTTGATTSTTDPTEGGASSTSGAATEGDDLSGCYDYESFAPSTVSFREDVMPIFAESCASCHSNPEESVYFGTGGTTEPEATAIYAKLLTGVPKQAPHLNFVVPSDPVRSYMMAKVEYDDPGGTCAVIVCDEPGCNLMAPPSAQLPEPQLGVLRSWVMGGALDN